MKPCANTDMHPPSWKPAHTFWRRLTRSKHKTSRQTKARCIPQSQPKTDGPSGQREAFTMKTAFATMLRPMSCFMLFPYMFLRCFWYPPKKRDPYYPQPPPPLPRGRVLSSFEHSGPGHDAVTHKLRLQQLDDLTHEGGHRLTCKASALPSY